MVQMNYLAKEHRPQSNDPDYWSIWNASVSESRTVDWGVVANEWQEAGQIVEGIEESDKSISENTEDEELPF